MAVIYNIQAEIVDLRRDQPLSGDSFLVDTNVWYWLAYNRASQADQPPRGYQIHDYPAYIAKAISARAQLNRCELSLAELAHLIEKTELEIFSRATGFDKTRRKEFRHNYPIERTKVVAEIQAAWGQIQTMARPLDVLVDETMVNTALIHFQTHLLDGYDLFMIEAIKKAGIQQILTDDGDFATIPGIQVFTANRKVLQAAQQQGRLLAR